MPPEINPAQWLHAVALAVVLAALSAAAIAVIVQMIRVRK